MSAARRWAEALAAWAIPAEILAAAPESPYRFPPALFTPEAGGPDSPSRARAREALGDKGSVLDVGVGGGDASLPLRPAHVTGVDSSEEMLATFAANATQAGIPHLAVHGTWPVEAEPADVVVCHHVFYNVADLGPFARALHAAARRRVVAELTAAHPQSPLNGLWLHFHGIVRPTGPTADDAAEVLSEHGIEPHVERWQRPPRTGLDRIGEVAWARRRLCLDAGRDDEIDAVLPLGAALPMRDVVTFWWDV